MQQRIDQIVFVNDATGEICGEVKNLWAGGVLVEFIPADGGPIADAIESMVPAGCHIEFRTFGGETWKAN